ncbi:MAG: molecular chaperone [Sphingobacteriales bacterium]|nr:molecular chaperone [Sphingobacteriales bacterium]
MVKIPSFPSGKSNALSKLIYSIIALVSLFNASTVYAQGDLFVNPKRLVFEGQKRSQEINLANIGKDTARYVISFVQIRMKDDGSFKQIEQPDSGQNFASNSLRIFPRTVILAPNESQVVKVQTNQTNKLLPGEYRSHLYFRSVAKEKPLGDNPAKDSTKTVSVKLIPVFGISIPIIIRVGENDAKVTLSDLQLQEVPKAAPVLKLRLNRTGSMSVYGDITVDYISNAGKITQAGFIKGISVYTPNKIRDLKITLDEKAVLNFKSGKMRVTYAAKPEGKTVTLASEDLALN